MNDLIFTGNCQQMSEDFKNAMKQQFEMADLGLMSYFLGIKVQQTDDGIFISQKKYVLNILKHFKMESSSAIRTPITEQLKMKKEGNGELVNPTYFKSIVGSFRYLTSTQPDIIYGVGIISLFMEKPYQSHLQAAKRILRYVNGTCDHGIFYSYSNNFSLVGYIDSNWGGDVKTKNSIVEHVFLSWNKSILMVIKEATSCSIINYRS